MKVTKLVAFASVICVIVVAHRAENFEDQAKVDESTYLTEEKRAAYEAAKKEYDRNQAFDAWKNESDPIERFKGYIHRYAVELGVISLILTASINWFFGRYINNRLASQWLKEVNDVLVSSFSYIPEECKAQDGTESIDSFEDQTSNEYPIALSGRESLWYASFNLVTKPRHDIATTVFTSIPFVGKYFANIRDTLWIEIPIDRKDAIVTEILLIQRKELEAAKKAQPHIDVLMAPYQPNLKV